MRITKIARIAKIAGSRMSKEAAKPSFCVNEPTNGKPYALPAEKQTRV